MHRLPHPIANVLRCTVLLLVAVTAAAADSTKEPAVKIDASSFKCITEMTHVRHFYVDNLLGNVKGTVAIAQVGKGVYPVGSVIQLVPTEAMVKQQKGFNPQTKDWEFFALDVSKDGTKIYQRGYEKVNNRFGLNCFTCHMAAKADFDFVCEQDHGCAPIPITRPMFGALQRTDPRCKNQGPVTAEDQESLKQLEAIVKTLTVEVKSEEKK